MVEWAKEKWIGFKNADERNIPALKQIKGRPSMEDIKNSVFFLPGERNPTYKKLCLYISQQYCGYGLKEIGEYYQMRGSAVSQSNRRFKVKLNRDKKLKALFERSIKKLNVET